MQALQAFRPFAGVLAVLAQAFAAPRQPRAAAWDDPALLDERQRTDAGLGPGEFEPRPPRGRVPAADDPGPAMLQWDGLGL